MYHRIHLFITKRDLYLSFLYTYLLLYIKLISTMFLVNILINRYVLIIYIRLRQPDMNEIKKLTEKSQKEVIILLDRWKCSIMHEKHNEQLL